MVTKEDVKRTLDCVLIRKPIKFALIFFVIFELIVCITIMSEHSGDMKTTLFSMLFVGLIVALFFGIPLICLLCKHRSIVNNYKNYDVYEVVLNNPKKAALSGRRNGRAYYYIITFTTKNNQTITTKTRALWSDGVFPVFDKRDYDNKKVKILYDEQKDKVYVLGK